MSNLDQNRRRNQGLESIPMLPPALVDELRVIGTPPNEPESAGRLFEAEVVSELTRLEARRRARFQTQRLVAALAAVAIFVAIARSTSRRYGTPNPGPTPASLRRSDLDGDGRVDVLDVLLLSSAMRAGVATAGSKTGREWDVNADGAVDDGDLGALAGIITRTQSSAVAGEAAGRIATVTVRVDPAGRELSAVQARVRPREPARVIGIDPGDEFSRVWYDPAVLGATLEGALVLAAIRESGGLTTEATLATFGVWVTGDSLPEFEIEVDASAGPGGERYVVVASVRVEPW